MQYMCFWLNFQLQLDNKNLGFVVWGFLILILSIILGFLGSLYSFEPLKNSSIFSARDNNSEIIGYIYKILMISISNMSLGSFEKWLRLVLGVLLLLGRTKIYSRFTYYNIKLGLVLCSVNNVAIMLYVGTLVALLRTTL